MLILTLMVMDLALSELPISIEIWIKCLVLSKLVKYSLSSKGCSIDLKALQYHQINEEHDNELVVSMNFIPPHGNYDESRHVSILNDTNINIWSKKAVLLKLNIGKSLPSSIVWSSHAMCMLCSDVKHLGSFHWTHRITQTKDAHVFEEHNTKLHTKLV